MVNALKWIVVGQVILVMFVYLNVALWAGQYVDAVCVEGRLSRTQAEAVTALEWKKCPKYRVRQSGGCRAEKGDRVIVRECSRFMRRFTGRNSDKWKTVRRTVLCDWGLPLGDHAVCHATVKG